MSAPEGWEKRIEHLERRAQSLLQVARGAMMLAAGLVDKERDDVGRSEQIVQHALADLQRRLNQLEEG